jgi:alkylation response protein AidB-like acyl-CoA dehydrogenase
VGNNVGLLLMLEHGSDEQKAEWVEGLASGTKGFAFGITEPEHGSDATHMDTYAVRDGAGATADWLITGAKTWNTGIHRATYDLVFARTSGEPGDARGITAFLTPTDAPGFRVEEFLWTFNMPTDHGRISLDQVRVPHSAILGEEGRGFELAMRWIGRGRYLLPARALGACERLVEMGMEHARQRVTFGEPIANRQAIQWMVADSAVEIEALRWLVLSAAWQVDHDIDSRQSQSMAKLYGGVKANEIVDRVLQMHGGMGYTRELPVERWYRELRVLRIYEGTDEIQRRTIARNLLSGHVSVRGHLG